MGWYSPFSSAFDGNVSGWTQMSGQSGLGSWSSDAASSALGASALAAVNPWLAVGKIGFDLWQGHQNRKAQKRANEQNTLFSWLMMQDERNYNHPVNVMKRLQEAGLNPMLIYGKGAGDLTSKTVAKPAVSAPIYEQAATMGLLREWQDLKLGQEQIAQVRASRLYQEAQTKNVLKQNSLLDQQIRALTYDADIKAHDHKIITRSPLPSTDHNRGGLLSLVGAGLDWAAEKGKAFNEDLLYPILDSVLKLERKIQKGKQRFWSK